MAIGAGQPDCGSRSVSHDLDADLRPAGSDGAQGPQGLHAEGHPRGCQVPEAEGHRGHATGAGSLQGVHAKKRVSFGTAKREKPAAIVKYRIGYTHWIMDGTKPHRIRFHDQKVAGVPKERGNIKHPGAKGNPVIEKVADQYGDEALNRVADYLLRAFGLTE